MIFVQEAQRAREEGERRRRERGHDRRYHDKERYREKYRRVCLLFSLLIIVSSIHWEACNSFHSSYQLKNKNILIIMNTLCLLVCAKAALEFRGQIFVSSC